MKSRRGRGINYVFGTLVAVILFMTHFTPCHLTSKPALLANRPLFAEVSSMQRFSCLTLTENSTACFKPQKGVPLNGRRLPLLLGFGPAKTSSTLVFDLLQQHSGVTVADASPKCCGSELYFFHKNFAIDSSAATMARFFKEDKPDAVWAAEKTPAYFDNALVPLRVKALFGSNVRLLLTHREPVAALVSLFFYRDERKNITLRWTSAGKSKLDAFVEWAEDHLHNHEEQSKCRQQFLLGLNLQDSPEADWVGLENLEQDLYWRCPIVGLYGTDSLQHFLYKRSVLRWVNIFGKEAMYCVGHEDLKQDAQRALQGALHFLGLNITAAFKAALAKGVRAGKEHTPEQRLAALYSPSEPERDEQRVAHVLGALREVYNGEFEWVKQFCSEVNAMQDARDL
jgi:hypothetical protein